MKDYLSKLAVVKRVQAWVFGFETKHIFQPILAIIGGFAVAASYVYFFWYIPPQHFPTNAVISIPEGLTVAQTVNLLEAQGVVKSGQILQSFIVALGGENQVKAGDYFFERPMTVLEVSLRLIHGEHGLMPIRITIPEGATTYEIAAILEKKLGKFDAITFLAMARNKEGYLFPDTYFFLPNASITQVLSTMEENFYIRIEPLEPLIAQSGHDLHEILTMASLLEKEARTTESRRMIAGILWNRLAIDMPLQVDAVFGYIHGTSTFHPKFSDLKVESPYNTYKYKGLPPGPIANPGLNSIEATLRPIKNDYIFYLTGRDGRMYYSKTFEQHLRYKAAYLK